eukprot:1883730-Rhodomonas_salina.1
MACESLTTLQAFKTEFLTRFKDTDEGCLCQQNPTVLRSVGQAGSEDAVGVGSTALQKPILQRWWIRNCTAAPWPGAPSSGRKGAPVPAGYVQGGFDVQRPRTGALEPTFGFGGFRLRD